MRSNDVFARMTPAQGERFLAELREGSDTGTAVALGAAAQAFKLRPQFLRRQPRPRQAEWMRRALSRSGQANVAEEVLAEYFLGLHRPLLVELLEALDVEHEDGELREASPAEPPHDALKTAIERFRKGDDPERRELLLRAFAAQSAISWPGLEQLLT